MKKLSASECLERARNKLRKLIAAEKAACQSACRAVENVARRIGSSPMKVRTVVGGYRSVRLEAHEWENLKRAAAQFSDMRTKLRKVKWRKMFIIEQRSVVPCADVGPADALAYIPEDFL